uniref:Rps4 n=1 Tax=Plasmodium berghei TaxID=5821 RepID=O44058_PLABE|nr:rps4 [Plasmodium berghei]
MIKFLTPKIKMLKKLNLPFLLYLSSKYNYKLKINKYVYQSYFDLKLKFVRYICYNYGITFKPYLHYLKKIQSHHENHLYLKLLNLLEPRLDVFLVNMGFLKLYTTLRYYIRYKYVYLNKVYGNYYNIKLKGKDIIFFNKKIKYIISPNLIYRYNIYIYISNLYKYNFIKSSSFNDNFIICIYNFKIKILNDLYLNNILYIYNNIYNI